MKEKFRAATAGDTLKLFCYDDIGPAYLGMFSAETVAAELEKFHGSTINLRINSNGGDVDQAIAIFNLLQSHGAYVVADIDGVALSAASFIMMAADKIRGASNCAVMVHDPWMAAAGNAKELRKAAAVLDTFGKIFAQTYANRTHLGLATVQHLLAEESWMSAQQAKNLGFIDEISQASQTSFAKVPAGKFRKTPAALIDHERRDILHDAADRLISKYNETADKVDLLSIEYGSLANCIAAIDNFTKRYGSGN